MIRLLAASLLGLASLSLSAQTPAGPEPLALVNARVVDVTDGTVQSGATVVLRGGRIESVGQNPAPAGVKTIEAGDRYVVPGLIDAHGHIGNLRALRTALEACVATVRSAGVSHYADVGVRELVKRGAVIGPDVVASGYHVRTMVAEQAFFDHPGLAALMRGVTTTDAI